VTDLLRIGRLSVTYRRDDDDDIRALRGVDLSVGTGEVVTLVGESGSGKSTVLLAVLDLLPPVAAVDGSIEVDGRAGGSWLRGGTVGAVFQDPVTSLHPVRRVGDQVAEVVRVHRGGSKGAAAARVADLFALVGLDAASVARRYPHELSGGQCQRVALAAAMAGDPKLLLADEPTSGLDVIVQSEILTLLRTLRDRTGLAILLVTHDLGVAASMADRVAVLYEGRIVEEGLPDEVFGRPAHDHTKALVAARL
jgi:ABC-type glutathione transport system ATPase component